MSRKTDQALEQRLAQLFEDAHQQARIDVHAVMTEAARQRALGESRVAILASQAVEACVSATLDDALVSLDKTGGRQTRARLVRVGVDSFFRSVVDLGKQGPSFAGSRDALIDQLNEDARLRMQRRVDTHLGGWNDPKQPWHVRHPFAWEWFKIVAGFASGVAVGVVVMLIKARWFGG